MKHLMINNAGNDVFRHVTPVQHRINADNFGVVGITGELNRILLPHRPSGTPGYLAVYFVCKVLVIDLVKEFLEMEVPSIVTKNSLPRFGRGFSDLVVVRGNKVSKHRRYSLVPTIYKTGQ